MVFETSKRLDEWVENHRKKYFTHATAGEQFVFVPSKINQLFRNGRMFGISKRGKYFVVRCTNSNGERKWIGSFTNKNIALLKYKEYKEKALREVADKYKDKIPLKLYNAIYNWEV